MNSVPKFDIGSLSNYLPISSISSITYTDNADTDNASVDSLSITTSTLHSVPPPKFTFNFKFGYNASLTNAGTFVVDKISFQYPPQKYIINAKPIDYVNNNKEKRTLSYQYLSLTSMVAKRLNCDYKFITTEKYSYLNVEQTNESDLSFLARLCKEQSLYCFIKNNTIIVSSKPIDITFNITEKQIISMNASISLKNQYKGVKTKYYSMKLAKYKEVEVGTSPFFIINNNYPTKELALTAAKNKLSLLNRNVLNGSLKTIGNPIIFSGVKITIASPVTPHKYFVKSIKHRLSQTEFTSTLEFSAI